MTLELGTRVTLRTHLVRVELDTALVTEALGVMKLPERAGRIQQDRGYWKLWVPQWWASTHLHKGLVIVRPVAAYRAQAIHGIVVGQVTLQQGRTLAGSWDESAEWWPHGTTRAYRIAYDMNRQPVNATADMIQETTP